MKSLLMGAVFAAAIAGSAQAQSLVFGAGYSDFSETGSEDGFIAAVELHGKAFLERGNFSAGWGGVASIQETGDAFIGAGLVGKFQLQNRWFVETSVMPGAYFDNEEGNDLGSTFEIRSLLGVGRELRNGSAVSVSISHKSNASTAERNPGVNSFMLRWHKPL
ncbi:acyloxyacyl hydrolase [Epibacterium sp. SM1969]|uniref:Acyloxyacyl hydrolase n=1 Tax=Tritonibacter aquimaris TaxID=2663379 RepID=A0A844ARK1_9RHOB|nr:acyloxyacyl hydrolase [Tritonibacter aquimaris]MQY43643.1 acyloxyacyl hydrolase [Tritonibacter aquimaris]